MLGLIVKILVTTVFAIRAIDSKLKNDIGQAAYYMTWLILAVVVFNR